MAIRRGKQAPKRRERISPATARAIELMDWLHECAAGERKASAARIDRAIKELEKLVPALPAE